MTTWRQARFQRRYGDRSEAFKRGYREWSPLAANCGADPFEPGSGESRDYLDGAWWAQCDYDEDRIR